jgi:very-short-patch-repair endonuclease
VDFVCLEAKLVIEIDGGQHLDQMNYDQNRTGYLESLGFNVIRFWNNEVLQEIDAVLNAIYFALADSPSPQLSPLTGERE